MGTLQEAHSQLGQQLTPTWHLGYRRVARFYVRYGVQFEPPLLASYHHEGEVPWPRYLVHYCQGGLA